MRGWRREDLVRRVRAALDAAVEVIETVGRQGGERGGDGVPEGAARRPGDVGDRPSIALEKVVAEAAMLALCAAPLGRHDGDVAERIDALIGPLIAHARGPGVLAAICSDPGRAREHAVAHTVLSHLGHPDRGVDRLLDETRALGPGFGPERPEHRRLELAWLDRLWPSGATREDPEPGLLERSMLGRPIDALGATRLDLYAFTHAVMYATDLGARRVATPRPPSVVTGDAEAALAFALDTDDLDLTAELCLTWPMLRRRWRPGGSFAFGMLAAAQDELGFLPGPGFERASYDELDGAERGWYGLATSHHATLVMGFLCAVSVSNSRLPLATVPPATAGRGAGTALLGLLDGDAAKSRWMVAVRRLGPAERDSLAELILAVVLRRARNGGDLSVLRRALDIAIRHRLLDGPAPGQAAALLRRAVTLDALTRPA